MSRVRIAPAPLSGEVYAPPSKSAAHRAILCAALCRGECEVFPIDLSNDVKATLRAITALGAGYKLQNRRLHIDSSGLFSKSAAAIDCGESGSTLRFLIPIAAAGGVQAVFSGHGRLPERPIGIYRELLPQAGVHCETAGGLPLRVSGQLRPGVFTLPGDVSSQFVTGLLLALPLLSGDSELHLSSALESAGYVRMTISMLQKFGVYVRETEEGYFIPGGQQYRQSRCQVEGDWSQAAFFMAAGALSAPVTVKGLDFLTAQGDSEIEPLLSRFGAGVHRTGDAVSVLPGELTGCDTDVSQIPDLVPILAVVAALSKGRTVLTNAARLRLKESDRLHAVAEGLNRLGAKVKETPDSLIIDGVKRLHGGEVEGYNDHRIVMALSIAAIRADGEVLITDGESIDKSYPNFFDDYNTLGGMAHVI